MKIETTNISDITLDSIKGYKEEKEEIKKYINLLKNYDFYKEKGIYVPRGLILQGPPGTGKTMFAKAIANGCGVPFYNFQVNVSGDETLKMLKDTFEEAKKHIPAIIYIDEIDKIVGRDYFDDNVVRNSTQFLLTELDGLNTSNGLMLIASTNDYYCIPDSLLRSGRMDKKIIIDVPDLESREEIIKYYIKDFPQFNNIDVKKIAFKIEGLTGADIKTLVNNTLINCVDKKELIEDSDFLASAKELHFETIGKRWKNSRALDDTIIHELGHSIVSYELTGNHGEINCIKYGDTAGHTSFNEMMEQVLEAIPEDTEEETEEKEVYTRIDKNYLLNKICIAFGGMAAEEVFFQTHLAGSLSDLRQVNIILDNLIANYWLGEKPLFNKTYANKLKQKLWKKTFKKTYRVIKKNKKLILFLSTKVRVHGDILSYDMLDDYINRYKREQNV